jgi:high-affinity Fe2+/Pb2+ permease
MLPRFHREKVLGVGIDLLAAAALTGVGIVFHLVVQHGFALRAVEVLLLGMAVIAILAVYNWCFNKAADWDDDNSHIDRQSARGISHPENIRRALLRRKNIA